MVPIALVRPSRNTIFVPGLRNSGFLINAKMTSALSPVRMCSTFILVIVAVCLILPQWTRSVKNGHDQGQVSKWILTKCELTHGLVVDTDGGRVVENENFRFKDPRRHRVQLLVYQVHAFSNV